MKSSKHSLPIHREYSLPSIFVIIILIFFNTSAAFPFEYSYPEYALTLDMFDPAFDEHHHNFIERPPDLGGDDSFEGMPVHDYLYGGVIGPKKLRIKRRRPRKRFNKYHDHVDRGEYRMSAIPDRLLMSAQPRLRLPRHRTVT